MAVVLVVVLVVIPIVVQAVVVAIQVVAIRPVAIQVVPVIHVIVVDRQAIAAVRGSAGASKVVRRVVNRAIGLIADPFAVGPMVFVVKQSMVTHQAIHYVL